MDDFVGHPYAANGNKTEASGALLFRIITTGDGSFQRTLDSQKGLYTPLG